MLHALNKNYLETESTISYSYWHSHLLIHSESQPLYELERPIINIASFLAPSDIRHVITSTDRRTNILEISTGLEADNERLATVMASGLALQAMRKSGVDLAHMTLAGGGIVSGARLEDDSLLNPDITTRDVAYRLSDSLAMIFEDMRTSMITYDTTGGY